MALFEFRYANDSTTKADNTNPLIVGPWHQQQLPMVSREIYEQRISIMVDPIRRHLHSLDLITDTYERDR